MNCFRSLVLVLTFLILNIVGVTGNCYSPPSVPNGSWNPDSRTPGNYAYLTCNYGYKLRTPGVSYMLCQKISGYNIWQGTQPACEEIVCASPPDIVNGKWTSSLRSPGNVASYQCNPGYKFRNPDITRMKCELVSATKVQWSGETPSCREKAVCPDPGTPRNGTWHRVPLSNDSTLYEGTVIRVICDDGYDLIGSESITCGLNGNWNSSRGICKPDVSCPKLPVEPNGFFTIQHVGRSDFYFIHDVVKLWCKTGFKPFTQIGFKSTIYCDDDGTWNWNMSTCRSTKCQRPKPRVYQYLEEDRITEYDYNEELKMRCPSGYQMLGPNWNRCTDKDWLLPFPECKEITCPDPGTPEDGSRAKQSGNSIINSTVSFECLDGYAMAGSKKRTCRSNGQWDGRLTTCSNKTEGCNNPGIPVNGYRFGNSFETGENVTYECYTHFTLTGSAERECLPDGQWSGNETFCRGKFDFDRAEVVKFRLLVSLDKKMITKDSSLTLAGSLPKTNSRNHLVFYFILDYSVSVDPDNFLTSIKFAAAVINRVGISSTAHIGAVFYGKTIDRIRFPLENISEDGAVKKQRKLKDMETGSNMAPALLDVLEMVRKVKKAKPEWRINSTVFLITNGNQTGSEDPVSRSSLLKEAGVEINVIGLVGIERKVNTEIFQSLATSPKHVFYSNGFETVGYLVEVMLKNTNEFSRCGIIDREEDIVRIWSGSGSKYNWPWLASIEIPEKGICGGSVIDNSWILTAAHCFDNMTKHQEENVNVTVGIKILHDHSERAQRRTIARKWIHPSYIRNSSDAVPDFDVAVIKLSSPLKYGKYVRHICLPPAHTDISTQSSLYGTGQLSTVLGFEKNNDSLYASASQSQVNVSILKNDICQNSASPEYKDYITDSMMCTNVLEGRNGSCSGDSGGPLMQSLEDSSKPNSFYWVQVGIVSLAPSPACGVPGSLGFYTNVAKVVGWIEDAVAEKIA